MDLAIHSSDDEETIALKEQLLLAKLKRKKLQTEGPVPRPVTPPPKPQSTQASPVTPRGSATPRPFASPKQYNPVQVLNSPSPQKVRPPVSPARILLGIDKGLTAKDISLKRTPEKPKKTFNQRLAESKDRQDVVVRRQEKAKQAKFNTVPAYVSSAAQQDASLDTASGLKIHGRLIADRDVQRCVSAAETVMSVRQFFAAPEISDGDHVVWGIVGQKSDAKDTTAGSKFCALQLTDFKTDVNLYLYDGAFDRYWTLPLGALVYLLNPVVQKPRQGRVSLKVVDADCVLEVGKATHFGVCRSIKADGTQCTAWVDASRQEVCDYHVDLALSKTANKRMEFAGGTRLFDPRKKQKRDSNGMAEHRAVFGDRVTSFKGKKASNTVEAGATEARTQHEQRLKREADTRQREREMLAKLLKTTKTGAGHEYFETVGDSTENQADDRRMFSAQTLRKIGFDPTRRLYSRGNELGRGTGSTQATQAQLDASLLSRNAGEVDLTIIKTQASLRFTKEGLEEAARATTATTTAATTNDSSDDDLEITYS